LYIKVYRPMIGVAAIKRLTEANQGKVEFLA